jgi:hypothetical protein
VEYIIQVRTSSLTPSLSLSPQKAWTRRCNRFLPLSLRKKVRVDPFTISSIRYHQLSHPFVSFSCLHYYTTSIIAGATTAAKPGVNERAKTVEKLNDRAETDEENSTRNNDQNKGKFPNSSSQSQC